jgi:hypothetical protein
MPTDYYQRQQQAVRTNLRTAQQSCADAWADGNRALALRYSVLVSRWSADLASLISRQKSVSTVS